MDTPRSRYRRICRRSCLDVIPRPPNPPALLIHGFARTTRSLSLCRPAEGATVLLSGQSNEALGTFFKNLWGILQEPLGDSQEHLGDSSRTSRGFFENLQTFFKNLGGILQEPLGDSSRTLKHSSRTSGRFFKNVWQILDQPWKLLIG